jgi:ketosteroid isomerase-like protein
MSQENVEVVRRIYDALARRDRKASWPCMTRASSSTSPPARSPTTSWNRLGRARRASELRPRARETFENFETRAEELIDAGEQVVSVSKYRGRGRKSGVEIDGPFQFGVWRFREGQVKRVDWYATRNEALEAVGLRE